MASTVLENVSERDLVEKEIEDKGEKCPTRRQGRGEGELDLCVRIPLFV